MKLAIKSGSKTVTTAGTRVALSSTAIWARGLKVSAPAGNAGAVFLGDVTVAAANGLSIAAGVTVDLTALFFDKIPEMPAVNLANVYVDAATNADKLTFLYFEEVL